MTNNFIWNSLEFNKSKKKSTRKIIIIEFRKLFYRINGKSKFFLKSFHEKTANPRNKCCFTVLIVRQSSPPLSQLCHSLTEWQRKKKNKFWKFLNYSSSKLCYFAFVMHAGMKVIGETKKSVNFV